MKAIQTFLIAAAALMPFTGCAEPAAKPAAVPIIPLPTPEVPRDTQVRYYVPSSETQATHLNQVLAKAARLELSRKRWDREAVTRIVEGDELRAYLLQFKQVQQWYVQHYRPNFRFRPSARTTAVFFDAEGNKLMTLQSAMTYRDVMLCYTTESGKIACLIHVLGGYLADDSEPRNSIR